MHTTRRFYNSISGASFRPRGATLAILIMLLFFLLGLLFLLLTAHSAQAQTYTVIHTFTGGGDGAYPVVGLTMDAAGNLYGTAGEGGSTGNGTVFKLKHSGSGWVLIPLYSFQGGNDGSYPFGRVAIGKNGTLYGTTADAGGRGSGTVFHLTPSPTAPKTALVPWNETVLYRFTGGSDGAFAQDDLTFDQAGSIYGTAASGGYKGCGVVYKLTSSGGGWTQTVLYSPICYESTGGLPYGGVIFDSSGNLDGVLRLGGTGEGAVYQLSPSGSGWTEQTLYTFTDGNDGDRPAGGLILDSSGNLYGTTLFGGSGGGGTVFELAPFNGGWTFNVLYGLSGQGWGSWAKLLMDAAGNLYGTTFGDGAYGKGSVFKLTLSGGVWTYTSLHDFTDGSDGGHPYSSLVFDANGNLYGTASSGGQAAPMCGDGCGVVFEITP